MNASCSMAISQPARTFQDLRTSPRDSVIAVKADKCRFLNMAEGSENAATFLILAADLGYGTPKALCEVGRSQRILGAYATAILLGSPLEFSRPPSLVSGEATVYTCRRLSYTRSLLLFFLQSAVFFIHR